MTKNLYIFSYGLSFSQITLETIAVFKKCDIVYCPVMDKITAEHFTEMFPELGPKIKPFKLSRQKETERIVLGAFRSSNTVGFLTFGNPAFLNGNLHELAGAAARKGIRTAFFSAVSSIDALITLFKLNIENELRLIDISRIRETTVLTPDINTMFFSVNRLNFPEESKRKKMFLTKIAGAYAPDSPVYLAACCANMDNSASVLTGTAGALKSMIAKADPRQTLFIPAASRDHYWQKSFYSEPF